MARVRIPVSSSVLVALASCLRTLSKTSPKRPNSVFTAPSRFHTSLERFSSAKVRKPICRLCKMAESVVGPASTTRCTWFSSSASPGRRSSSAYRPSVGTKRIAKSVVCGGSMYLLRMSFANPRTASASAFCDFSTASLSAQSCASSKRS